MITTRFALLLSITALAALAAHAQTPAPAQKAPVPPAQDIRCLLVAMQFAASTEANQKTGGNMLAMYYMGRLDKYPGSAIEDAIVKELPTLNAELFKTEAGRCGKALKEKGEILTLIGTNLTQRAQLQQAPAKAPPEAKP